MKKLIVLYGEENSGKTITLKMVYQQLKKMNLLETYWFKYYDSDGRHNDFRDVLVLPKPDSFLSLRGDEFDSEKPDDLDKAFPDDIDNDFLDELDKKGLDDYFKTMDFRQLKIEEIENTQEDGEDEDEYFEEESTRESPKGINLDKLIADVAKLESKNLFTIGLILEGDYGFLHRKTRSTTTHHKRSLYNHLQELSFCDVVICACSILKGVSTPVYKPVNCVAHFIRTYKGSLKYYVERSHHYGRVGWAKKLKDDKDIANKIIKHI
ncbi:MAG: hypothetical protein J6Y24_06855 [Bacteroidales bacterium]|nr:hypothetical protein [Bacteroidales bacterium]